MRELIKRLFGTGSLRKPIDPKDATSSDPLLAVIKAAAPDPELVAEDQAAIARETKEATADRAVERAEKTPAWMRHVFGELPVEYRVGIGIFVIVLVIASIISWLSGESRVFLTQLLDMLKAVLGGIAGGALVRRRGTH